MLSSTGGAQGMEVGCGATLEGGLGSDGGGL